MARIALLVLPLLVAFCLAEPSIYFQEDFADGDSWKGRWVQSKHKTDYGQFEISAGKFYGDAEKDKGLQTSQDAKFYAHSAKFPSFSNKGKTLVIQFTVKHEQNIDCGGGYIKFFPSTMEQTDMHGESEYNIMFGKCAEQRWQDGYEKHCSLSNDWYHRPLTSCEVLAGAESAIQSLTCPAEALYYRALVVSGCTPSAFHWNIHSNHWHVTAPFTFKAPDLLNSKRYDART